MIEKLKRDLAGRYEISELPEKINEIIDVLNKSFITDEPDTIYGKTVTVDEILNGSTVLNDITCDTLVPLDNEHTLNNEVFDNMLAEVEQNPFTNKKCPHCGESYYTELYSTSTAVYYPPIYKDGVNINTDRNTTTQHCRCMNCGKEFTI